MSFAETVTTPQPSTERVCRDCGGPLPNQHPNRLYCSVVCRSRYLNRRHQTPVKKAHYDPMAVWLERNKQYRAAVNAAWGTVGYLNHTDPLVVRSEEHIANVVLPAEGFVDIVPTRPWTAYFPADILARKDGVSYLVEVTLQPERKIPPKVWPVLRFFNARFLVVHITADLSRYYLVEPKPGQTHTNCRRQFYADTGMEVRKYDVQP